MKENKEHRITFRLSQEEYERVTSKATAAHMSTGAYVRASALKHRVVVVEGLPEIVHELKGISRNINQLTTLANMGKLDTAYLNEATDALYGIYDRVGALLQKERR